jgi:hypothetical protein
VLLQPVFSK